jgi:transposase
MQSILLAGQDLCTQTLSCHLEGLVGRLLKNPAKADRIRRREEPADAGSYVSLEARVPKSHPLRRIREIVDTALAELSPEFEALYSRVGRPSIPPEKLLRALLLQVPTSA